MPDSPTLETRVRTVLSEIKDPETGRKLTKQIHEIVADENRISVRVGLTSFAAPLKTVFHDEVAVALKSNFENETNDVSVEIVEHDRPAQPIGQVGLTAKAVIAVAAGKGG